VDGGDGGDGAAPCNDKGAPSTEACLVSDKYAVFVAAGAVGGTGSKESPLGTIAAGIAKAKTLPSPASIVCNATCAENVQLKAGDGAMAIYGGFTCPTASGDAGDAGDGGGSAADWAYTATKRPLIAPPTGSALTVTGLTSKVVISDVDLASANATANASSIAAIVSQSTDVTFLRVKVTAGTGGKGHSPDAGDNGANGVAADGGNGGAGRGLFESAGHATGRKLEWAECLRIPRRAWWRGSQGSSGTTGDDGVPSTNVDPANAMNVWGQRDHGGKSGDNGTVGSPGVERFQSSRLRRLRVCSR